MVGCFKLVLELFIVINTPKMQIKQTRRRLYKVNLLYILKNTVGKYTSTLLEVLSLVGTSMNIRMWTLFFGWPQLGLISPVRFPSWSRYILGSGVELNK